jgi:tetratricopeptide (TPR) repeat protein
VANSAPEIAALPSWLDWRYYDDLDPAAERAIRAAGLAWDDEATASQELARAAAIAPEHEAVLIAQYRYHLYKHRYEPAAACARRILARLARALGIPEDWQAVRATDADFTAHDPRLRFWMFVLQAYGYVLLRLGRHAEGLAAFRHLVALDTGDQTKTRVLLQVIEHAGRD